MQKTSLFKFTVISKKCPKFDSEATLRRPRLVWAIPSNGNGSKSMQREAISVQVSLNNICSDNLEEITDLKTLPESQA